MFANKGRWGGLRFDTHIHMSRGIYPKIQHCSTLPPCLETLVCMDLIILLQDLLESLGAKKWPNVPNATIEMNVPRQAK